MEPGDAFCGDCGASAPGVVIENARVNGTSSTNSVRNGAFFSHVPPRTEPGRMTNATRYLCAAAYLSPTFGAGVIRNLVSSHRSVAPSVGIDLGPIMRHCLRARSIQMVRDGVLAVLLLIGLFVALPETLFVLLVCFFAGFLPSVNWARKSLGVKIFAIAGSLFVIGGYIVTTAIIGLISVLGSVAGGLDDGSSGSSDGGFGAQTQTAGLGGSAFIGLLLGLAVIATQLVYTYVRSRTLCDSLGPDAAPQRFRHRGQLAEARIAQVEGAQYGNVVLYSGRNPFVGTGRRERSWGIAIELQREVNGREAPWERPRTETYAPIDPVELHQAIRRRLDLLRDDGLPPNERISSLTVHDHIVGTGLHRWDSPLIDPARIVPYSLASSEAVDALIRHPQAGIRYYQRVSVCDEGAAVWSGPHKVIDGSDQDIAASALIYVAVEGRMLYLEFVSSVMPPVHPRWRIVDVLPAVTAGRFFVRVVVDSLASIFRDLIYAPVRAVRSLVTLAREGRTYQEDADAARETLYGDIGAQLSVRELGAAPDLLTYIQELDAEKYTKLIERLVNDTVLDFLAARGVDTSAYAASAGVVINNAGVMVGGGATVHGPVASAGVGGSVRQSQRG
jgi:hypothetical protein